jgi:hypothetical protein
MATQQPTPPKKPPQSTPAPAAAKALEKPQEVVGETKEDVSFFDKYKTLILIIVSVLLLFSLATVVIFFDKNTTLEKKIVSKDDRIRAAVVTACKVDITEEPKAVSFVREENDDGDMVLMLKCEPLPTKKKE